jgi:hypothetical protein
VVVVGLGGKERGAVKKGHVSIPRGQNSRCQARHIPEMEFAAFAFTRGTFIQCAACGLNVPGIRMYVGAALCIYPPAGRRPMSGRFCQSGVGRPCFPGSAQTARVSPCLAGCVNGVPKRSVRR